MKTVNQSFDDEDFYKIQEIKNRSGLSWGVFFVKAAEAYADSITLIPDNGDADE